MECRGVTHGTYVAETRSMKSFILLAFVTATACTETKSSHVAAYLTSDTCHAHADAAGCSTDPGCQWLGLGLACPADSPSCPSGVCVAIDPCGAHADQATCAGDTADGCAWADVGALCPAGAACPVEGGFCYRVDPGGPGGGCACACPLVCPDGADCPPCACDCGCGDVVSGGTVVSGGGTGTGSSGSTGTSGGGAPTPGTTTTTQDPCSALTDPSSCSADTADRCTWYAIGAPCPAGGTCPGGGCQGEVTPPDGGGAGCACACPACAPGEACPPCACDCTGSCSAPGVPPTPTPMPL